MSEVKNIFDFVNDLSSNKQYLFDSSSRVKFDPFMVNRAFSQHNDTILYANEMNMLPVLDKLLIHDFYFYSVSSRKRYGKWAKADNSDEDTINIVSKHYHVNRQHALQYIALMTDEEIKKLKISMMLEVENDRCKC